MSWGICGEKGVSREPLFMCLGPRLHRELLFMCMGPRLHREPLFMCMGPRLHMGGAHGNPPTAVAVPFETWLRSVEPRPGKLSLLG